MTFNSAPWSQARAWQTNTALVFLGLCLFLLSRHLIFEYSVYTIGFSGTSGWSVWCYLLACLLAVYGPTNRFTFPIILLVAIACRLAPLFADAFLSSDIYRYVWDGMVQHAGINPYRYIPADAHLTFLRSASDGDIYPDINRKEYAHTIYPPVAQMIFWVSTFLSPTIVCMKAVMVLFESLTLWTVTRLLAALERPREQAILFAWCPLLIWELAGSGHLDAAVMAFIGLALFFRMRKRRALTGLFLALAVLTKFYPLVLFPALYLCREPLDPATRKRRTSLQRLDWTMPAVMIAVATAAYAVYSSAGKLVFGFLGGYVQEEGIATGTRYFLLEQAQHIPGFQGLTSSTYMIFAAAVLTSVGLWAFLFADRDVDGISDPALGLSPLHAQRSAPLPVRPATAFLLPAFALACTLMLLFSPHYPWYIVWLVPFFALFPNLPAAAYILGLFYLCTTALAEGSGPKQFLLNQILYGGVALAVILQSAFSVLWRIRFSNRAQGA